MLSLQACLIQSHLRFHWMVFSHPSDDPIQYSSILPALLPSNLPIGPISYPSTFPIEYSTSFLLSADPYISPRTSPSETCLIPYYVPDTSPSSLSSLTPSRAPYEVTISTPSPPPDLRYLSSLLHTLPGSHPIYTPTIL